MSLAKDIRCFSKVLITGGYSILFEGNKGTQPIAPHSYSLGLVLSTSASYNITNRFNSLPESAAPKEGQAEEQTGRVDIESEGFNTTWAYKIGLANAKNNLSITQTGIKA